MKSDGLSLDDFWLTHGQLLTPRGIVRGAVRISRGRIAAIRPQAPRGARAISARDAYIAPGFIDLHVWGEPRVVSVSSASGGTTAFLTAVGPEPATHLLESVASRAHRTALPAAQCLGLHLEGPFLNPVKSGALPRRWMRRPTTRELKRLTRAGGGCVRLITVAPELPGAIEAIRWCARRGVVASLGHSDADGATAARAVEAGARAVTHAFNAMRPLQHRHPSLLDIALTEPRLTTMAILDGVHISPVAFRLLLRAKGAGGIALVTDSIQHQGWDVVRRRGAYYTKAGTLAGSRLTMMGAVRNAVQLGGSSLADAARMASEVPARLLGDRMRGTLAVGKRADLVVFDGRFRVALTIVGGHVVFARA